MADVVVDEEEGGNSVSTATSTSAAAATATDVTAAADTTTAAATPRLLDDFDLLTAGAAGVDTGSCASSTARFFNGREVALGVLLRTLGSISLSVSMVLDIGMC